LAKIRVFQGGGPGSYPVRWFAVPQPAPLESVQAEFVEPSDSRTDGRVASMWPLDQLLYTLEYSDTYRNFYKLNGELHY
jgi:hypothetical protein